MFKKLLIAAVIIGAGIGIIPAPAASAHQSNVSSTCETLSVNLSSYAAAKPAQAQEGYTEYKWSRNIAAVTHIEYKWSHPILGFTWDENKPAKAYNIQWTKVAPLDGVVVIDTPATTEYEWSVNKPNGSGWVKTNDSKFVVTKPAAPAKNNTIVVSIDNSEKVNTTFSTNYSNSWNYSDKYTAHTYSVAVVAWDGFGTFTKTGTTTPCTNPNPDTEDGAKICSNPAYGTNKVDVNGNHQSITITADPGFVIDKYCVKAGSSKQGDGAVYIDVTPPASSVVITHPSGKDISHYTYHQIPVTPEKPADKVTTDTDETVDCETKTVTIVTTTTTTGTILVNNTWVELQPVVTSETTTRPATEAELELAECEDVVVTPEDPKDDGDVLGDTTIKSLPYTSGDNGFGMIMIVTALAGALVATSIVVRRVLTHRI